MGGDRDGNPNVTPAVTARALRLQKVEVLREYVTRVRALADSLTFSSKLVAPSAELVESLAHELFPHLRKVALSVSGEPLLSRTIFTELEPMSSPASTFEPPRIPIRLPP